VVQRRNHFPSSSGTSVACSVLFYGVSMGMMLRSFDRYNLLYNIYLEGAGMGDASYYLQNVEVLSSGGFTTLDGAIQAVLSPVTAALPPSSVETARAHG